MRAIIIGLMLATVAGSGWAASPTAYRPAHNAYGQPDFEGTWSFNSTTRLERPPGVSGLVLSEEEAKTHKAPNFQADDAVGSNESEDYDDFNLTWGRLGGEIRSSWLIEPANGKLPYTAAGQAKVSAPRTANNPEERSNYERCVAPPQGGPPLLNATYNNHLTVLQTRDHVALALEANHELRLIRLTSRVHAPSAYPLWFGDSVGWYEGDTLVVETQGFVTGQSDRRSVLTPVYMSPNAKVTERFTRISDAQIRYEFRVEDPAMFTGPWRGEVPLTVTTEPTFEYACHEGNYGLANILSGAREEERAARSR